MAIIIDIDHEAGNLSEYEGTVEDSGDLSVQAAAALAGTDYGLQCFLDDAVAIYGYDDVTTSNTVRLRFYIDPNSLTMLNSNEISVCGIVQSASPTVRVTTAVLKYTTSGPSYRIQIYTKNDANANAVDDVVNITDAPHYVEMLETRATGEATNDGIFQWWVDGVSQGSWSNIDNYNRMGDSNFRIFLGAQSIPAGPSGTFYLDELVVNDDGSEIGPFVAESASVSPSISLSISPSVSPSISPSASESLSVSPSVSPSESPSISPSPSESVSVSPSISPSESVSVSPSISPSVSPSESPSASLSVSPSESPSISPSASESLSVSPSVSPSISSSVSPSPSIGPLVTGSVCWGHITGVIETNIETFADNWVGTGEISGAGDAEIVCLDEEEWMESNVVNTGVATMELDQNHYDPSGETITLKYRTGNTEANCLSAEWIDYTIPFNSLGYVQVRIEG